MTESQPCNSSLCLNNGTCFIDGGDVTCNCTADWTGEFCEIPRMEVDPCFKNPCRGGGECIKLENGYLCECPEHTQGHHCENDSICLTEEKNPCQNGGECVRLNGSVGWYECLCEYGFTGVHCEYPSVINASKLLHPNDTILFEENTTSVPIGEWTTVKVDITTQNKTSTTTTTTTTSSPPAPGTLISK